MICVLKRLIREKNMRLDQIMEKDYFVRDLYNVAGVSTFRKLESLEYLARYLRQS
jgi:hypothetical protein